MYYKIVHLEPNGSLSSYSYAARQSSWNVIYQVNQWVYPSVKHTKLYVFDSYENAMGWIQHDNCNKKLVKLFECKIKNPVKDFHISYTNEDCMYRFWVYYNELRKKRKSIKSLASFKYITGTVGCSAIKLTKEIPINW